VLTERDRLRAALASLGVSRVVIGHTPTPGARVFSRMDDTVFRIDNGMLNSFYGGRAAALIIEDGNLAVIYEHSDDAMAPLPQPRRVGLRPAGLNAGELETLLANAEIIGQSEGASAGQIDLTLRSGGVELAAVFVPAARRGVLPDLAAYRLDRLIGLDMVPVTVAREIDGEPGSVQFAPSRVLTETERSAQGIGGGAWCPLRDQFQAMYIFDSLIYNEGRTPERIRYSADNFQLILVGHEDSLSTRRGRPPHLRDTPLTIGAAWREALASLDESGLTQALEGILDRRRIRALLQRRDELLTLD
ncbi:MAG: hypothetical protein O6930_06625, partial [Gammaproteobacteria bacterium]|nr:hypothetical protein [Gammaproteobacteria bacterium]